MPYAVGLGGTLEGGNLLGRVLIHPGLPIPADPEVPLGGSVHQDRIGTLAGNPHGGGEVGATGGFVQNERFHGSTLVHVRCQNPGQ